MRNTDCYSQRYLNFLAFTHHIGQEKDGNKGHHGQGTTDCLHGRGSDGSPLIDEERTEDSREEHIELWVFVEDRSPVEQLG